MLLLLIPFFIRLNFHFTMTHKTFANQNSWAVPGFELPYFSESCPKSKGVSQQ